MINLRAELKKMIDDHGHWVVLRQAEPGGRCACVNPNTDDADSRCNMCLGSGYLFVDRFVKCRKSRDVSLTQTVGGERRTALAHATPLDSIFYFEYTTKPTTADFILEVKLDQINNEPIAPYRVKNVFDISDVREQRDQMGRVEFYAATAALQLWPEFDING